jgi:hypothetical protein
LVIDFLALPKVEGSMVGAGRVLTHPSGYIVVRRAEHGPARLIPAALDVASPLTETVLFVTWMSLIYDKNSINTMFTHVQ